MKYLLALLLFCSCAAHRPYHPHSEEDFVYVFHNRYWMEREFVDSFNRKPPDSLLLRNHPDFTLWGSK